MTKQEKQFFLELYKEDSAHAARTLLELWLRVDDIIAAMSLVGDKAVAFKEDLHRFYGNATKRFTNTMIRYRDLSKKTDIKDMPSSTLYVAARAAFATAAKELPEIKEELRRRKEAKEMRAEKRTNLISALKSGSFKKGQISRRHLRTRHELEECLKGLLRRDGAGMMINLLHFTDDGRVIPSLHTQDYGFMVRRMEELGQLENCKVLKGHEITGKVSRFCRSVLMISVQSLTALAGFFNADGTTGDWSCKAIYRTISSDGCDRFWGFAPGPEGGVMYDMCSNAGNGYREEPCQETFPLRTWEKVFAVNGYYVYDGSWATSSPGELKNKVLMLPGVYHGPYTERSVNWGDFFHEATSGAWTEFCRHGNRLTFEAVAEFTARVTLVNAYAKYFATPMTAFAVYTGKIKAAHDSGLIPKGHEFMDGLFLYRADYIKRVIEEEAGITVDNALCTGFGFQSRPLNVKGLGLTVETAAIERFMAKLNAERFNFVIGDMTDEQVKAWWNLSMKKFKHQDGSAFEGGTTCTINGQQVDLANKIIVFYWDDEKVGVTPDCLVDANALKVGFDPTGDVDALLKVLAMPHKDNGINRTSGQMLTSALAADYDRTVKQLEVVLDINLQERQERLTCEQGTALSWADFQGKTVVVEVDETGEESVEYHAPNYVDLVDKVAPVLSTRYSFAAWRKRVDAEVKQVSKMLNRLNLPVEGTHVTIVPDLGMVFGNVSVLGVNNDGVTEIFSNNPLATTITKEEYLNKYKTLAVEAGVSEEVQQDFEATVNGLSEGLAVVPADEITARANEGWDFDGDSMYLFKMNKGYIEFVGEDGLTHYRWATDDEEADGAIIWDCGNRYPKTNVDGFVKLSTDNWFGKPVCVRIK